MEASNRKAKLVWGPHLLACSEDCLGQGRAQVSAHLVHSKAFLGELKQIFSNQPMLSPIVIATMQHAAMELVEFGMSVDDEKDFLLERFASFAQQVCQYILDAGYWCDYIDPSSGLPMLFQDGNVIYNEVQSAQLLLGYNVMNAGCCKILLHPVWASAVYPASIVTTAPQEVVVRVLDKLLQTMPAAADAASAVSTAVQQPTRSGSRMCCTLESSARQIDNGDG